MPSVGSRIVLVKGEAGSGKSHVLTTSFKRAAAIPRGEVYPAVLQLTAPVEKKDYDMWLVDALFRQLSARHFADDQNQNPLRRLAGRLLSRISVAEQDEYLRLIDDIEGDGVIPLAQKFARKVRRDARELLSEEPPAESFIAVVLLAGYGDPSALSYLRYGTIDKRLKKLEIPPIKKAHDRIQLIANLGLPPRLWVQSRPSASIRSKMPFGWVAKIFMFTR